MSGRSKGTLSRKGPVAAMALVLVLAVWATPASAQVRFSKDGRAVTVTRAGNFPVPDATTTTNGLGVLTVKLGGRQLRGARIRDVNATLQTTGNGDFAAASFQASLTAPNGATSWLIGGTSATYLAGPNIGPLTLDDEAPNGISGSGAPQGSPILTSPYVGRAQPNCFFTAGVCSLSVMDGGPVRGTWTLRVFDFIPALFPPVGATVSVLNGWSVRIGFGRRFEEA